MTNKTFKEEVRDEFDKFWGDCSGDDTLNESKNTLEFIESSLDLYKQKILEALPKEMAPYDKPQIGFNKCLSEVKQIIENI